MSNIIYLVFTYIRYERIQYFTLAYLDVIELDRALSFNVTIEQQVHHNKYIGIRFYLINYYLKITFEFNIQGLDVKDSFYLKFDCGNIKVVFKMFLLWSTNNRVK